MGTGEKDIKSAWHVRGSAAELFRISISHRLYPRHIRRSLNRRQFCDKGLFRTSAKLPKG
jgi:hypothetical protein